MASDRGYNLLALSDLHLGCDLKLTAPLGDSRRSVLCEALVQFFDHHAARREGGKPWRLLLAGDVFDFVAVTDVPPPASAETFQVLAEERVFGLAAEEEKCIWKLRRIAARHDEVFHALARFIAAGNEVHFVRGNHDAELQFPSVQAELSRLLLRRTGAEGETLRALEQRVQFHAWFYLEPGLLYAEHGNAHDRYCLQSGFFDETPASKELELPMSSKVLRYFASRWAGSQEDYDGVDQMNLLGYIGWIFRMGKPVRIALDYFAMVARVLEPIARNSFRLSWRKKPQDAGEAQALEQQRLGRVRSWLARFLHAPAVHEPAGQERAANDNDALDDAAYEQAAQLLAVASRPAEQSLFASAQLFYVDRLALAFAASVGALGPVLFAHGAARLIAIAAVGLLFGLVNLILARRRRCDAHLLLRSAASNVAKIFAVRYVVMGHSHRRVDEAVESGARYLNLGSWSPRSEGLPHLSLVGEKAELKSFAYKPSSLETQPASPAVPPLQPQAA